MIFALVLASGLGVDPLPSSFVNPSSQVEDPSATEPMDPLTIDLDLSFIPSGPKPVHAIIQGERAPISGILISEERFSELIRKELALKQAEFRLTKLQTEYRIMDSVYQQKLYLAAPRFQWWEEPQFNHALGFASGVILTAVAIWAVNEMEELTWRHHPKPAPL
jgi:hypothetical protein